MDKEGLDKRLQEAGVSDDVLRSTIVENLDLTMSDAEFETLLSPFMVKELVSLAKCWQVPGFKQLNADLHETALVIAGGVSPV